MHCTYSWQFPRLDVYPTYQTVTNAVHDVHWRLTASDGSGHTSEAYGVQACGPIDPNNFTPFASLTFNQVKDWVLDRMGSELEVIQELLHSKIGEQVTPITLSLPPPWA